MKNTYHAIRNLNENSFLKKGDVLVLFGELFNKGYANGLVEEAEKRGLKIIRTTVGRREKDGTLRPLNAEESSQITQPFINVPLEAGFDLEKDDSGISPVDAIKDVKLTDWEDFKFPKGLLEVARAKGRKRFTENTKKYLQELANHIPAGSNVLFAHLMAGGVPRAKIVLPIVNRIVKGTGDRYLPSEKLIPSDIGQFCLQNFQEVTAETFRIFVEESKFLQDKIKKSGGDFSFVAYGYHGTEVLFENKYQWQSYTPYIQGWAKMKLEDYSRQASSHGIKSCVYNCPEILTNSSSIFNGVELSLYPLVGALKKEGPNSRKAAALVDQCLSLMKPDFGFSEIMKFTEEYLSSSVIKEHCIFEKWPQHTSADQLAKMLAASDYLQDSHRDPKQLITYILSEVVFSACGKVMINDCANPEAPVSWINHDVISKIYAS